MRRTLILLFAMLLAVAVMPAASAADHTDLDLTVARAPVAPDGLTAHAQTDLVVTFKDRHPSVDGVALKQGATITVELDDAFTPGPGTNLAIVLQGWPQSPPAPPPLFPWATTFDDTTVTVTLTSDWNPGDFGPGAKQVHLALLGWTNPRAGVYPVALTIRPDPSSDETLTGESTVRIQRSDRPAVSAVSLFSGGGPPPPFNNPLFQNVGGGEKSLPVGLYVWNAHGEPFDHLELRRMSARSYRVFDGRRTVAWIRVQAPRRARNHVVRMVDDYTVTSAFVTGVPVGLMKIQLEPDASYDGRYTIGIKMAGGNQETIRIDVGD